MANRMKEDEKNEKIIRGLLKLPGNRRCINCNSLGPQYVCTNFWTFVCTTCSGIHREFTHRVKSVSMAKFTSQEVACLKNDGGNERAKEIYLKDWDQQRNSFPDNSNVDRLRDFIKHVYEDRRYTGERGSDRPPRVKMADREDSYKQHSAPQSPPSEDTYERNNGERSRLGGRSEDRNFRYNYDGRSPGYDQDKQRYGDYKRSPAQFEGGDDKSGSRRSEDNKFLGGEPKLEGRSPSYQKELGSFNPPVVRPVRDILGENIPPLRVGEPPKVNGGKSPGGSLQTKRTSSSSNMRPIDGNPVEFKSTNLGSLIDFTSNPEPPNAASAAATATQTRQSAASTVQAFTPPINSTFGGDNWASFDSLVQEKGSQVSSNANTLDSVVSQLSVPAPSPSGNITFPTSGTVLIASVESMSKLSLGSVGVTTPVNMSILPPGGSAAATASAPASNLSSMAISGGNSFISFNDVQQGSRVQLPQHSLFPINGNQITAQPTDVSVGGGSNNQTWSSSFVSNVQASMSNPTLPSSQFSPKLIQDTSSGEVSKAPLESRSGGRNALPEDLFTATYASVPGWQAVPPHGMGFSMQYPIAMLQHAPTFPQTSRSINPFDVNSEAALVQAPIVGQAPMFPSMAPLQGAIPNAAPTSLLRTSSLGTPMHPQWVPSQTQVYTSSIPPQPLHYVSGMPQSMYIGQQMHNNLSHSGHQAVGGFGKNGVAFGPSNTNQQLSGRSSAPATPSSYSSFSGNPFG